MINPVSIKKAGSAGTGQVSTMHIANWEGNYMSADIYNIVLRREKVNGIFAV